MSETIMDKTDDGMTVEQWLAIRKEAALKIDAETAEVMWTYALVSSTQPNSSRQHIRWSRTRKWCEKVC
jgi:hypothetical protein